MNNRLLLWQRVLGWLALLMVAADVYFVFFYAPTEKYMGDVQRLMYYHVATAWNAYLAFGLVLIFSILYLWRREERFDHWAASAAEVGVLFTTLVLITGPLWARPVWNAWWKWDDPRLTATLILWLVYIAYLILRASIEGQRGRRIAAVFGIIGFVDVPIVHFSVQWWSSFHPQVISSQGVNMTGEMVVTLVFTSLAFMVLFFFLLLARVNLEKSATAAARLEERLYSAD
ncbi:MAG: cytochrome C assembly protein [Bacillus thermozeamaize]|uniref:Heme exporter protein C n=1 Tax=Bacillus thermozeamaize TaxID=230954 RepID=A0A1Y3PLB0_9BACI|nr:MAG: cytochrome C assembly protein [Bacillus thermozeamaize]